MNKLLRKREEGFTIIEVLIVLAIAGLIMLIVFLAVPALQRNSRNTQRANDAALIGGAVNECLANKNGQASSCNTLALLQAVSLDTTKLTQLTTVNVNAGDPADPGSGNLNTANVGFTAGCNAAGDALDAAGSAREAAILYRVETAGSGNAGVLRCIEI
jgi:prepilin-type N-terminal cleavage/methylation domain-containing protein